MSSVYIVSSVMKGNLDVLEPHAGSAYAFIRAEEVSREYALIYGGKINNSPESKTTVNGVEWVFYSADHGEVKVVFSEVFIPTYTKF